MIQGEWEDGIQMAFGGEITLVGQSPVIAVTYPPGR